MLFWFVMFAVIMSLRTLRLGVARCCLRRARWLFAEPDVGDCHHDRGIVLGRFTGGLIWPRPAPCKAGRRSRGWTLGRCDAGVFMALQELGIAKDIVTTAFAILFGAVALAMALAFGLGIASWRAR